MRPNSRSPITLISLALLSLAGIGLLAAGGLELMMGADSPLTEVGRSNAWAMVALGAGLDVAATLGLVRAFRR